MDRDGQDRNTLRRTLQRRRWLMVIAVVAGAVLANIHAATLPDTGSPPTLDLVIIGVWAMVALLGLIGVFMLTRRLHALNG